MVRFFLCEIELVHVSAPWRNFLSIFWKKSGISSEWIRVGSLVCSKLSRAAFHLQTIWGVLGIGKHVYVFTIDVRRRSKRRRKCGKNEATKMFTYCLFNPCKTVTWKNVMSKKRRRKSETSETDPHKWAHTLCIPPNLYYENMLHTYIHGYTRTHTTNNNNTTRCQPTRKKNVIITERAPLFDEWE